MKKLEAYENRMGYMVGGSILPFTREEMELEHKCNPNPNDRIVMIGDIQNPQSVRFVPYALARLVTQKKQGGCPIWSSRHIC